MVLVDPRNEVGVAVVPLAGPARRRRVGWRVVHPDPRAIADERGIGGELSIDHVTGLRPVPPRADGHDDAVAFEGHAVDEHAGATRGFEPSGGPFTLLVAAVQVVVPRARDQGGLGRDAREVLEHHRDLRVGFDDRRDVEVITGQHDEVVVRRGRDDPVELLQRVVKVRHQQDAHRRRRLPAGVLWTPAEGAATYPHAVTEDPEPTSAPEEAAKPSGRIAATRAGVTKAQARAQDLYRRLEGARQSNQMVDAGFHFYERDLGAGGGVLAGALAFRLFLFAVPYVFVVITIFGSAADLQNESGQDAARSAGLTGLIGKAVADAQRQTNSTKIISLVVGLFARAARPRGPS